MLDALIGNTDRHHQNWGIVTDTPQPGKPGVSYLAPTFDHASCLGCHESERRKAARLTKQDSKFTVETYCERARSRLYSDPHDTKALHIIGAFEESAGKYPQAAGLWLSRLATLAEEELVKIMKGVPVNRITECSREFAAELLRVNTTRLLRLLERPR